MANRSVERIARSASGLLARLNTKNRKKEMVVVEISRARVVEEYGGVWGRQMWAELCPSWLALMSSRDKVAGT